MTEFLRDVIKELHSIQRTDDLDGCPRRSSKTFLDQLELQHNFGVNDFHEILTICSL